MDTTYNEEALTKQLQEAKKSGDKKEMRRIVVEMLRPEAREALAIIEKRPETTKDNYGEVMRVCTTMGDYRFIFLDALVAEGYNPVTAESVRQLI